MSNTETTTTPSNPYIRESLADTGSTPLPAGSIIYASPDIIPRQEVVADPNAEFATLEKWDNNQGESVEFGSENYVYIRLRNPLSTAQTVYVHLYRALGSTLNSNSTWHRLSGKGGIKLDLPASTTNSGIAVIQTPIPFKLSSQEHQCLISYITDASFVPPITAPPTNVEDFPTYLLDNNTCGLHNLTIVNNVVNNSYDQTFSISNDSKTQDSVRTYKFHTALPINTVINVASPSNGVTFAAKFTVTANPQVFTATAAVTPNTNGTFTMSIQFGSTPSSSWHVYINEQRLNHSTKKYEEVGAYTLTGDHDTFFELSKNGLPTLK